MSSYISNYILKEINSKLSAKQTLREKFESDLQYIAERYYCYADEVKIPDEVTLSKSQYEFLVERAYKAGYCAAIENNTTDVYEFLRY